MICHGGFSRPACQTTFLPSIKRLTLCWLLLLILLLIFSLMPCVDDDFPLWCCIIHVLYAYYYYYARSWLLDHYWINMYWWEDGRGIAILLPCPHSDIKSDIYSPFAPIIDITLLLFPPLLLSLRPHYYAMLILLFFIIYYFLIYCY